ncbi:NAD(P)/FAD-dependent oxidoreductase [Dyella acidisoli]|uniref:FAD-dependent oxidoreductase n=1 Tax=Dyella acidisoli TaxID=1867834 RepID=A0ABQ5XS25_9GAMM|nr:FAD-binding oxidoreductase [Dyella acidisoli]GLQ94066.1 FAD-dependent oxidoreductase [Dyella acidisoli]
MKQPPVPSYYRATAAPYEPYAPLQGRQEARVAIIGGGFAGLNTALGLAERGVRDVVVLEREQVGFGASGRNGGFVFGGYSLGEEALHHQLGAERSKRIFDLTTAAVQRIRERVTRYAIPCDMVDQGVIWANWFRDPNVLRKRQRLLADHYGVHWEWLSQEELRELVRSERYYDGLYERNALHLHPLNYAVGLAAAATQQGVRVHENSDVWRLRRDSGYWRISTPQGELQTEQVVLACGGYLAGLRRQIDRAVLPIATYVMVTEPLDERLDECLQTRAAVYDTRFAFDYYRPLPDRRLLWGGRISIRNRSASAVRRVLMRDMLRVFPALKDARVDYAWSGLMSYARHQMPQIGTDGQGLWWAQAFGGHGLAPTCAAGELLAAAIAQDDEGWKQFGDYGLARAYKPFGLLAAQGNYWWQQFNDWFKTSLEG